jgi:hypothetical protein
MAFGGRAGGEAKSNSIYTKWFGGSNPSPHGRGYGGFAALTTNLAS